MKRNPSILLIGPSGAGKGTQAGLLADKYGLKHLQSGELLRNRAAKEDEFGMQVREALREGFFVPSEWIFEMIKEEFSRLGDTGVVIDGFSRKLSEIKMLCEVFRGMNRKIDLIFLINVEDQKVIERLMNRRVCKSCKAVFDSRHTEGVCPSCGGELYIRDDDNLESIKNRLDDYKKETSQVIDFLRQEDRVIEINGDQPIEDVFREVCSWINSDGKSV